MKFKAEFLYICIRSGIMEKLHGFKGYQHYYAHVTPKFYVDQSDYKQALDVSKFNKNNKGGLKHMKTEED